MAVAGAAAVMEVLLSAEVAVVIIVCTYCIMTIYFDFNWGVAIMFSYTIARKEILATFVFFSYELLFS